jgi:hypothetical protein
MYKNLEAISAEKHIDLKLDPTVSHAYAAGLNLVPLSYSEIIPVSRFCPVIFPEQDKPFPNALMSLDPGKNVFVNENGDWTGPYVPAQIRMYPFALGQTDQQDTFVVCIDSNAPHFASGKGDPLDNANGEPSQFLNSTMDALKKYYQELVQTRELFVLFSNHDIVHPAQTTVNRHGTPTVIKGFSSVDTLKLADLDPHILKDWIKRGFMSIIFAHIHSLANIPLLEKTDEPNDPYAFLQSLR